MGNSLPTGQAPPAIDLHVYLQDLPQLVYSDLVGKGKFLKTLVCKSNDQGNCVVKIFRKQVSGTGAPLKGKAQQTQDLAPVAEQLASLRDRLSLVDEPNLFPYQLFVESQNHAVAFLLRQYFTSNLSDRLATHPFPTDIEKRWVCYQLLAALQQAHEKGIVHGDVKSENVMVTSWNWVLLTDFAPFKPTSLPAEDDPAVFYYYFEPGNRRRCYIAPERFYSTRPAPSSAATNASVPPVVGSAPAGTLLGSMMRPTSPVAPVGSFPSPAAAGPSSALNTGSNGPSEPGSAPGPGIDGGGAPSVAGVSGGDASPAAVLFGSGEAPMSPPRLRTQGRSGSVGDIPGDGVPHQGGMTPDPLRIPQASTPCPYPPVGPATGGVRAASSADVFSVGCVIAELFLDGEALFDLSSLLEYRAGRFDPEPAIARIADLRVRDLVRHMIQRDAPARASAAQYLQAYEHEGGLFPPYFTHLFRFMSQVILPEHSSADSRVRLVCDNYGELLRATLGVTDPLGEAFFRHRLAVEELTADQQSSSCRHGVWDSEWGWEWAWEWRQGFSADGSSGDGGGAHVPASIEPLQFGTSFSSLYKPWKLVRASASSVVHPPTSPLQPSAPASAGVEDSHVTDAAPAARPEASVGTGPTSSLRSELSLPPHTFSTPAQAAAASGVFSLVIGLITSCIRHVSSPRHKVTAIALLGRLGCHADDETRLQRVVPYLVALLNDKAAIVRAHALCALTQLLCQVTNFPPSDAQLFPQYILPAVVNLPQDQDVIVHLAFAECLPLIAQCTRRFLDVVHWKRQVELLTKAAAASTAVISAATDGLRDAAVRAEISGGDSSAGGVTESKQAQVDGAVESETVVGMRAAGGPSAIVPASAGGGGPLAAAQVLVTSSYDANLKALHERVKSVLRSWVQQLTMSPSMTLASELTSSNRLERSEAEKALHHIACLSASADYSFVKRALLADLTRLSLFFGHEVTEDFLIPHLFTFLNDKDWQLRMAFSKQIVGVSASLGPSNVRRLVLPVLEAAIQNPQDPVVHCALTTLAGLADLGILDAGLLLDLVSRHAPLLCHPGPWVRAGMRELVTSACIRLGWPDALVLLGPALEGVCASPVGTVGPTDTLWATVMEACAEASESTMPSAAVRARVATALASAVLPPVSRELYDKAAAVCLDRMLGGASRRPARPGAGPAAGVVAGSTGQGVGLGDATPPTEGGHTPLPLGLDESSGSSSDEDGSPLDGSSGARPSLPSLHERVTETDRRLLCLLEPHIRNSTPEYRYTVFDQVRLRERVRKDKEVRHRSRPPSSRRVLDERRALYPVPSFLAPAKRHDEALLSSAGAASPHGSLVAGSTTGAVDSGSVTHRASKPQPSARLKHRPPPLPYTADAIAALPVHSISVPDQRFTPLHPTPPTSVLPVSFTLVHRQPQLAPPSGDARSSQTPAQAVGAAAGASLSGPAAPATRAPRPSLRPFLQHSSISSLHSPVPEPSSPFAAARVAGSSYIPTPPLGRLVAGADAHPSSRPAAPASPGLASGVIASADVDASQFLTPSTVVVPVGGLPAWNAPSGALPRSRQVASNEAILRRAGRAARRLFLRHGVWDPNAAMQAGASGGAGTSAFFYPLGDGGNEDPSLLSSDEEDNHQRSVSHGQSPGRPPTASRHSRPSKAAPESPTNPATRGSVAADQDSGPVIISTRLPQTPLLVATHYSNAVLSALQVKAGSGPSDVTGATAASINTRIRVKSVGRARTRSRYDSEEGRRPSASAAAGALSHRSAVDGSYVSSTYSNVGFGLGMHRRDIAGDTATTGRTAAGRKDSFGQDDAFGQDGAIEARRSFGGRGDYDRDGSSAGGPGAGAGAGASAGGGVGSGAGHGAGGASPAAFGAGGRGTPSIAGNNSSQRQDVLPPRMLASLERRLDALGVPTLPPPLGYLQRSTNGRGPVAAHALRLASGLDPDASDSDSDVEPTIRGEVRTLCKARDAFLGRLASLADSSEAPSSLSSASTLPLADGRGAGAGAGAGARASAGGFGAAIAQPPPPAVSEMALLSPDFGEPHVHPQQRGASASRDAGGNSSAPAHRGAGNARVGSSERSAGGLVSAGGHAGGGPSHGSNAPDGTDSLSVWGSSDREISRPPDVGDGTGYVGAGPGSFLTAERGWGGGGVVSASSNTDWSSAESPDDGSWGSRPRGLLLATCRAHNAPVSALSVCQDHSFFVSAGEDSTAYVWLSRGIDREVSVKPALRYTSHSGPITSMTMVDNTSSVATGSSTGSVHVWKVDITSAGQQSHSRSWSVSMSDGFDATFGGHGAGGGGTRGPRASPQASGVAVVSKIRFRDEGAVQAVRHFNSSAESVLVCATQLWHIHGVDLRARATAWDLKIPPELGYTTAMELCPGDHAVVIGTNRGVIAVYDLRFQLLVCAWRHSGRAPVTCLFPYTTHVQNSAGHICKQLACAVGTGIDGELSIWNLETGAPIRVLRTLSTDHIPEPAGRRASFLSRIPTRGNSLADPRSFAERAASSASSPAIDALAAAVDDISASAAPVNPINCLLCPLPTQTDPEHTTGVGFVLGGLRGAGGSRRFRGGMDVVSPHSKPHQSQGPPDSDGLPVWMLTGSADGTVRCWDMDHPQDSHTVLGLDGGETRHVYHPVSALPYGVADQDHAGGHGMGISGGSGTGGGSAGGGGIHDSPPASRGSRHAVMAAVDSAASVSLEASQRYFRNHYSPDGISMTRPDHLRHPPPPMILSQQPKRQLDDASVMPGAFVHSSDPTQQLKGPTLASTRHDNGLTSLAWLDIPARLLLTGGRDGVVKVWR